MEHEGLLELFRNRPELAPQLLRDVLGVKLPDYQEVRLEPENLTEILPTEYRADLVMRLVRGESELGIVVEVQLQKDPAKEYAWPSYLVALRTRHHCPACVLVVTVDEAVARWARRPIELGPGGAYITPIVLGPSAVPVVTNPEQAAQTPELAVLSAMAHGKGEPEVASAVADAALKAAFGVDSARSVLYHELVLRALSDDVRKKIEEIMNLETYEPQHEFIRRYFIEGKAKGQAEGEARGEARGEAKSVVMFLEARKIALSGEQKECILSCKDLEVLDRWIRRAAVVASAEELFAD